MHVIMTSPTGSTRSTSARRSRRDPKEVAANQAVIEAYWDRLCLRYRDHVFYGDLQVLWDVSFDVRDKEILVLVGANGAGKSTTLKTISGPQAPEGSIEFDGVRLDQLSRTR